MNCFQHIPESRGAIAQPPRGGATKKKADPTTQHALIGFKHPHLPQPSALHNRTCPCPLTSDRTRNARAPTSPRSIGFCAIWDCISSSSSSRSASSVHARSMSSSVAYVDIIVPNHHFLTSTRAPRPHGAPQEQPAARSEAPAIPEALAKDSRAKEHDALKGKGAKLTPPQVNSLASPHRPLASDSSLESLRREYL